MKKQQEQKTGQSGNGKEATIYINPRTDFGFKRLFLEGLKAEVRLLDLLKTFFPDTLGGASHLVVKPTELLGDIESEKRVVLDTLAFIDEKTRALIEMQRAQKPLFVQRSIFYTCRLVSKGLNRGDDYDIPTVLTLCITDRTLPEFADLDGFFHLVQLRRVDGKNISEKIILGYLDLSKFAALNPGQMKDMQFADRQEKWGYTLANVGRMDLQDLSQEDEVFRSVFEDSMHQKLTKMEKEEYKKSVLEYEDVQEAVRYAREQGLEQGLEQGRAVEKRQLALNMLAEGLDPATVARISGLTEEELLNLTRE
jgi:predicted transposase/invertase (TIGR01784 family)